MALSDNLFWGLDAKGVKPDSVPLEGAVTSKNGDIAYAAAVEPGLYFLKGWDEREFLFFNLPLG